jgi:toxin ParE1/3/4
VVVQVTFSESAVRDLQELMEWYTAQSAPEEGERLTRDIFASLDQLAAFPASGRVVPEFDQPWLRELIRPPFRIVYRVDGERVRVVRAWRSERLIDSGEEVPGPEIAPLVRSLVGSLKGATATEDDYRRHLEEKYQ